MSYEHDQVTWLFKKFFKVFFFISSRRLTSHVDVGRAAHGGSRQDDEVEYIAEDAQTADGGQGDAVTVVLQVLDGVVAAEQLGRRRIARHGHQQVAASAHRKQKWRPSTIDRPAAKKRIRNDMRIENLWVFGFLLGGGVLRSETLNPQKSGRTKRPMTHFLNAD